VSDPVTFEITGLKEFEAALSRLSAVVRTEKVLLALEAGAWVIVTYTQNNIRTKLNRHPTGNMANSTTVKREGNSVFAGVWGVVYAKIHEFGGVIKARTAPFLSFMVDGKWIHTKSVVMPARPFFRPAVDEHLAEINQAIGDAMGGILEEEIK
jgi:HK97 gp10 family phage protein